jgi:hypothetical protein
MSDDEFLNTDEAAAFCRLNPRSLVLMRKDGRGPRFMRPVGTLKFLYRKSDLEAWLDGRPPETPEQRTYRLWTWRTGKTALELTDPESGGGR